MRRHPRLVGFLWRWHRRLGLAAAVLAILLAVTGIALNHSHSLALDRQFVKGEWLYRLYGEAVEELPAYRAGPFWAFRNGEGRVFLDDAELVACSGKLVGAVHTAGLVHVACEQELLLATERGRLVEVINAGTGLPVPLSGVGQVDGRPVIHTANGWKIADLDTLDFQAPVAEGALIEQHAPGTLPATLREVIPQRDHWLSWERVILDLHSGRLGGTPGVLLMDIAGLFLCLLGLSGVAMWWLHRRGGRRG